MTLINGLFIPKTEIRCSKWKKEALRISWVIWLICWYAFKCLKRLTHRTMYTWTRKAILRSRGLKRFHPARQLRLNPVKNKTLLPTPHFGSRANPRGKAKTASPARTRPKSSPRFKIIGLIRVTRWFKYVFNPCHIVFLADWFCNFYLIDSISDILAPIHPIIEKVTYAPIW